MKFGTRICYQVTDCELKSVGYIIEASICNICRAMNKV